MAMPPFLAAATNPLMAALQGGGPPAFGGAAPPFEEAELDLIRRQAEEAKRAGSPINDWPRVGANSQALADLYSGYHGGRTRGEVAQGVGVPATPTPKVGVGTTLYRADPGTRQFTFRGGDPTGDPSGYLAGQIAAAQGAGGTPENSPQVYNMVGQQTAQQDATAKLAHAKAEQLKAEALMGQTDYVRSGDAHTRAMQMMALEKGQLSPMALEALKIPQPGDALAAELKIPQGDLSQAMAFARGQGITSAPPDTPWGKAIGSLYGPQLQYIAQGQNPYKWGNPDLEQTRSFLGMPGAGTAQVSPAAQTVPGANPGVLRNTAPMARPGLRLGTTGQMLGIPGDTTLPSPDFTSTGQMLGLGAWKPLATDAWKQITQPAKKKRQLASRQPALPRIQ